MQREEILERLEIVLKIIDKMDGYLENDGTYFGANWCEVGT